VGLIDKAVNKVENQENPPVKQEMQPQDKEKEESAPAEQEMSYQSKKIQENPPVQKAVPSQPREKVESPPSKKDLPYQSRKMQAGQVAQEILPSQANKREETIVAQEKIQPHFKEQDERSYSQQVMPAQAKGKGKKKLMILTGAVLLVGIFLGLGYLLLIRPSQEVPQKTVRRSISARQKLPKPTPISSEQKPGDEAKETPAEAKATISDDNTEKPLTFKEPVKETGLLSEQVKRSSSPESKAPVETSGSQASETKKEPEIPKSDVEEPAQPAITSNSEDEGRIPEDAAPSDEAISSPEPILDEAVSPAVEETPEEELTLPYATGSEDWLAQEYLTVTPRSDSRAQRYYNKGVSYQKEGELDGAIKSYKKALSFDPDHLQAHVNLSTAYLQVGRLKEAEEKLIYLYALKPNDCRTLFNLGLLLYQTKELPSAEVKLKRLLALEPLHLDANLLLGSVLEEMGNSKEAAEYCMKAYYIDSANPQVIYRAGRSWDMVGDEEKAIRYYRLFLNTGWDNESGLRLAVRERLNYLVTQREGEE